MWVHADGVEKDVHTKTKEAIFSGAACCLRSVFEDYEEFESTMVFSVDLINESNLTQRAIFAGEAFLMIFDPACSLDKRAMHEAFIVEFLMHTVTHIAQEIEEGTYDLRKQMFPVIDELVNHSVDGWEDDDIDDWQEAFGHISYALVGEHDFEYGVMLNRLDELGASVVGKLFSSLNLKSPEYFDGYDSDYIEDNLNLIVRNCAKIIEFIEKYQKSGNFRAHP